MRKKMKNEKVQETDEEDPLQLKISAIVFSNVPIIKRVQPSTASIYV